MRNPSRISSLVAALGAITTIVGCAPQPRDDDPIDAIAVSDGKADADGISEGTPLAAGILRVANELSLDELEHEVTITTRAAKGIVADRPFSTLTALDAVAWVGPVTFGKLSQYAQANGYTDDTSDNTDDGGVAGFPSCSGVGIRPTLGPLNLAGGTRYSLTRTCDAFACGAWSLSPQTWSVKAYDVQSFRINPTGDAWIESAVGPAENDGEYTCQTYDYIIGYAQLDPTTGDGVEHVYSGYECNVNHGSGGPRSQNPARDVSVHYGAACVSALDAEPAPQEGLQTRYLTIFTW